MNALGARARSAFCIVVILALTVSPWPRARADASVSDAGGADASASDTGGAEGGEPLRASPEGDPPVAGSPRPGSSDRASPSPAAASATAASPTSAPEPHLAFADVSDPNPGSGSAQILAGWIALGVGAAGIAQGPLCKLNDYATPRGPRRCRNVGIAFGVIGVALAIPWLTFGYQKRNAQRAWKQRHGLARLHDLTVSVASDELTLGWRF